MVACMNGQCVPTCAAGFGDCDGDPSNGCEADLLHTNDHCGACGYTCNPVACENGTCIVAQGFSDMPVALALDGQAGGNLYFTAVSPLGASTLSVVPRVGGAPSPILQGTSLVALAFDGSTIYVADYGAPNGVGAVLAYDPARSLTTTLATPTNPLALVARSGGGVVWIGPSNVAEYVAGTTVVVANAATTPTAIGARGGVTTWTEIGTQDADGGFNNDGTLDSITVVNSCDAGACVRVGGLAQPVSLVADNGGAFVGTQGDGCLKYYPNGGDPIPIDCSAPQVTSIALDPAAGRVCWVSATSAGGGPGQVKSAARDGSSAKVHGTVAVGATMPLQGIGPRVVTDGQSVYWTDPWDHKVRRSKAGP
jgi:hypothetical protein